MCGGGGGNIIADVIEVAVVVTAIVQPELIPAIGTFAGASAESAAVVGATIVGGVEGGTTAALRGKDPVTGALTGAGGAFVGSEVGQAVGGTLGGEQAGPFLDASGNVIPGPTVAPSGIAGATGSQYAGDVAGRAAGGFAKGFTQAELGGSNLDTALRRGEIQGATGAVTEALFPSSSGLNEAEKLAKNVGGYYIGQDISNLFSPQRSAGVTGTGDLPAYQGSTTTTGQAGPGSQALGQALRVGDPGAPIQSPGGGEANKQPVWNIASLRTKDETGS
jgi:hypothetical protein